MMPFAIKCYLPGRRTQYVLYVDGDTSIELGRGADLCPRGFNEDARVQFRLVAGQWFVVPQLGVVRREDGSVIDGVTALELPSMLTLGCATVVVDSTVDPRIPARVVYGIAGAAPATGSSARGRPARFPPSVPRPRASPRPAVAHPASSPTLVAAEAPKSACASARNELVETRILDMSQLGVSATVTPAEQQGPRSRTLLAWLSAHRTAAYALVGVALVVIRLGVPRSSGAIVLRHSNRPRPEAAASAPSPAPSEQRMPKQVDPLPPGYEPNATQAGYWYATGDYTHALREYRGLAAQPGAEPVFAIVAHALERRLEHPEAKR